MDDLNQCYYIPPSNEVFKEVKKKSIKIWKELGNSKKSKYVESIENVKDNFMYIFGMFDPANQKKLLNNISAEAKLDLLVRIYLGGMSLYDLRLYYTDYLESINMRQFVLKISQLLEILRTLEWRNSHSLTNK